VYAYGFRSNYRFGVNEQTGHVYVGTVGPDGKNPDPRRGPAAHEELEVVPPGGGTNHGWPRCIANNIPYNDYNWQTSQAGDPLSCDGMTPAAIYYTYQPSPTSPWVQMGSGGTCSSIMGGSVYRRPDSGALSLPQRFDDHLLWMEWCRGGVLSTPIRADGSLDTAVDKVKVIFTGLSSPIDNTVGPDGALYIAEYAARNYNASNSRISRIICTGCTPDPADYGGAPVAVPRRLLASGVPAPSDRGAGAAVIPAVLVVVLIAGAVRRRRAVV
jgi:hypothetical protein